QSETHEVDLSEEWASLSQQLEDAIHDAPAPAAEAPAVESDDAVVADFPVQPPAPIESLEPLEAAPPMPAEPIQEEHPAFDLELEAPAPARKEDAGVSA